MMPDKISKQLEVFNKSDGSTGLVCVNGFSEYKKDLFIKADQGSGIIYNPREDTIFPLGALIPPPSSWMIPRSVIGEIGFFDEKMRLHWDDGDYLVRLTSNKYSIYLINENLVTWRAPGNHLEKPSHTLIRDKIIFLEKNYNLMKRDRNYLFRFYRTLGKDALNLEKNVSRKFLFKAFLMKPFDLSILSKILRTF
jgi:hypothetical protein